MTVFFGDESDSTGFCRKKGTVSLSTSQAWLAVAGCSRAETFSQLSSISFAQPCRAFASTINEFAVFVVKEEENRHFVGIGKRGKTGTKKDKGNKPIRPKRALQLPMHWQAFIFFRSSFFSFYGKAGGENSPFMGTVASSVKLLKTTVTPVIIKHIVQQWQPALYRQKLY